MTSDMLPPLPNDKRDMRGAEALVARGYPAVAPVLPLTVLLRPDLERLARFATDSEAAEGLPLVAAALLPET